MANAPYVPGTIVNLRPLDAADAPVLVRFLNDPAVHGTLLLWRPVTEERERDFLSRMAASENDLVLGIERRTDGVLLGVTGLHGIDWRDRHAQFGIFVGDPAEWGKGYGGEATELASRIAFERLDLHRLWLHVYATNGKAARAYERAGYVREGVLREHVFRSGARADTIVMGLLATEWRARRSPAS